MKTYRDLEVWQAGMTLVERCYEVTKTFPRNEQFGLTSQLRRAAVSIPGNLAEGACRHSDNAFANHVNIALGSHAELETLLELACRLAFVNRSTTAAVMEQADLVGRLLNGLRKSFSKG